MAIGDTLNQNPFGIDYNAEDEEEKKARLAAQNARMGAGFPALDSNIVAQVPGIQNIRNPGAFDPANMEPARPIMSAGTVERVTPNSLAVNKISDIVQGLRDAVGTESVSMDEYRVAQATQTPSVESALGATPSATLPVETPSVGAQEQGQAIPQGSLMGSYQAPDGQSIGMFQGQPNAPITQEQLNSLSGQIVESSSPFISGGLTDASGQTIAGPAGRPEGMSPFMDQSGQVAYADPETANRMNALAGQEAQENRAAQQRFLASDAAKEMSNRQLDSVINSTYSQESKAREARVRASDRQLGESQTDRDTRIAQSRTTGGQTQGLSFDDARRRAEGQLAARGVKNPSASQVNALARGIQAGEPERLAELETKRAVNEARLKTAQATLDRPEFEGKVYTINGVTFAQTSNGGAQVISTGTETPEEATAKMKDYAFALEQIDKARKAYQAGDIDKANDIFTAAEIQKDGFATNATEYFKDSITPPASKVTDSGLTQQQESGIQNVMATNKITREDAIKALKEAGKLK